MERRTFITGLVALPALSGPALAQNQQLLGLISKYLNQLVSIHGQFTQVNGNGSRTGGKYWLHRPGLLRFEYANKALVLADGVNIGILDPKSNKGAQKYPIGTTPLRFLLRRNIDLTQDRLVSAVRSKGNTTEIDLRDPKKPRDGYMTLYFQNNPARLLRWKTTEKNGKRTTVVLDTLDRVKPPARGLFSIEAAERKMFRN